MAQGSLNGKRHVVIVGAGFAGLECAQVLARHQDVEITLIDRNNFHVFQPLLYQVSTGLLSASNAAFNLRALLRKYPNIAVKMSQIDRVDLTARTVYGEQGDTYAGDYLVLAAGGQPNFFDTPGALAYAYPLYSLQDAEQLRAKLIKICESAELSDREFPDGLNVVIVGGGATGVEVAGALADLLKRTPPHLYKRFNLNESTVSLVDGGKTVLGPFNEKSRQYATRTLRERGVKLFFENHVKEVTENSVLLANGDRLPAQVTIWAGGIKAAGLAQNLGIELGHAGRIDVQADLSVTGYPGVFALGDFVNCKDKNGDLLPQLASVAKQAGHHCGENILADLEGHPLKPFSYLDKGIMAMIGRNAAVAEVGSARKVILGHLAFLAWIGVHVLLLDTLRVQLQTLFEWVSEYFGKVNVATILDQDFQKKS